MIEIKLAQSLLAHSDRAAAENRERFGRERLFVVNLMSSPGAGKTSLLEHTLEQLAGEMRVGIIEGDIQGSADADRLARFGVPVAQLSTHGGFEIFQLLPGFPDSFFDLSQLVLALAGSRFRRHALVPSFLGLFRSEGLRPCIGPSF